MVIAYVLLDGWVPPRGLNEDGRRVSNVAGGGEGGRAGLFSIGPRFVA